MSEILSEDLRLGGRLGSGAMGSVWQAEDMLTGTQVAVKTIIHEQTNNPDLRKRFEREAKVCLQLKSPHAVHTSRYGISPSGTPFLVMELLSGTDLTHLIEIKGPLDLNRAGQLVQQICSVLEEAHALGVVHRDIKPDNIFLTETEPDLFVKVLDFGIAKLLEQSSAGTLVTGTGMVIGTPGFMSPEQTFSSKNVDYRSDLYSTALVAYYALTAEVAFEVTNDKLPRWMHELKPPSTLVDGLSPAIDAWFNKALARQPQNRFASAQEQAAAFHEAVQMLEGGTQAMRRADVEAALAREQEPDASDFAATVVRPPMQSTESLLATTQAQKRPRVVAPFAIPPQSIPDKVPRAQTDSRPPNTEAEGTARRQFGSHPPHEAAPGMPRRQTGSHPPNEVAQDMARRQFGSHPPHEIAEGMPRRQTGSGNPYPGAPADPGPMRAAMASNPDISFPGNPSMAGSQIPTSAANNPVYQPVKRRSWLAAAIVVAVVVVLAITFVLVGAI